MRKVILSVAVSLDGYIEGPTANMIGASPIRIMECPNFLSVLTVCLLVESPTNSTLTMGDAEMPGFPKLTEYVFSTTLKEVKPGDILIKGDIEAEVKRIKNEPGKDIWLFGGASLTASLLNLGLIDEIGLGIYPILLGGGKPLFSDIKSRIPLTLTDTKTYSSGLIGLTYTLGEESGEAL